MIKKIYGGVGCHKCEKAKKLFSDAEYFDIKELSSEDYDNLLAKARMVMQSSLPILFDESDNIVTHAKAGI
jgi:glutaredoxin